MSIRPFADMRPRFAPDAFVDPDATVIGHVVVGAGASVWPGAVLRGDVEPIELGAGVSFQDTAVAHADPGFPVTIGDGCIVGHGAIVHGATVGPRCLIGMGATLLTGCEIGEESIVGAGALVTGGKTFAPRSLIVGSPARVVREVTDEDLAPRAALQERYARRAARYSELGLGVDLSEFGR